ncbi:MAG: ABC-F family ATP-binding cassette domain-containing protein [Pseudomonas qingdaonensis]|uniref:ABC-F family ATP-binding cassette domain-containing protein n=1 Tax=Pseudomonas qingdaonensis TaxID=2056231 RepID=UPI003315E286
MTNTSSLTLDSVTYALPDGRLLFSNLTERFDQRRTGLVGRNGVGKSILARLMAGQLEPSDGRCLRQGRVHYLAQQPITSRTTVADLAQVRQVIEALQRIEAGSTAASDFETVGERWNIREQLHSHLAREQLGMLRWDRPAETLSGGQAMRVALLGAFLGDADYLILDEPTNHLDAPSRAALMIMLERWNKGLLVISHDRTLLASMQRIVELSPSGLHSYGGAYSAFTACKARDTELAERNLERLKLERQRQARDLQRQHERLERHQARAGHEARHSNQAKILLDRQQQRSEATAGRQQRNHLATRQAMDAQVREAAQRLDPQQPVVLHAPARQLPPGSQIAWLRDLELPHIEHPHALDLVLYVGQRLALTGANGSGKSTLLKVLAGQLPPRKGECETRASVAYLDQQCSLLDPSVCVLEHVREACRELDQSSVRTRLAQLGLDADRITLPSGLLSGGERLKAALAAVLYSDQPAQLLLLDEPSNHLDLPSLQALEQMLCQYQGTLLVASHDLVFLQHLQLQGQLCMPQSELHGFGDAQGGEATAQGEVVMGDDGLGA